jgi:hypothetical protein
VNIFVVNQDPVIAAQSLCDKHVPKMLLESTQLLCSAFHTNGPLALNIPYKLSYKNHPCTKWVRQSQDNFEWLLQHSKGIVSEFNLRFNKPHACEKILNWCEQNMSELTFSARTLTDFAQAMPENYKSKDAVSAYRTYYRIDKSRFAQWNKGRNAPDWWQT